jgi:hypothetical protein
MFVTQIALVSRTKQVECRQLNIVAAALQKQAIRDFEPLWHIPATVDAFETLGDVPLGYWPVIVVDDVRGAAGVHLDRNGQPFALVEYDDGWALTASHETLEMLADPWGNRLIAGNSPKPSQGRVEFLVEVADPPEAAAFGYTVNGILLSDFLTPEFWDPVAIPGLRYSFRNSIPGPRQILDGGYISWHDPVTDHWWQQVWFGSPQPTFRDLGILTNSGGSLRAAVDAKGQSARRVRRMVAGAVELQQAVDYRPRIAESTASRAGAISDRIEELQAGAVEADWQGGDEIEIVD